MPLDIVGGVYGERCAFPHWDQIFGSGGRAAAALSSLVKSPTLHTLLAEEDESPARSILESFGVKLAAGKRAEPIGFEYLHCLADPVIYPRPARIAIEPRQTIAAKTVLQFGMLEWEPRIEAELCVYDPQSPQSPRSFRAGGSSAKRLAIVANSVEAARLSEKPRDEAGAALLAKEGAEVVVIKRGINGAEVVTAKGRELVPAFETANVFTIGSGDIFAAAFTYAWGLEGQKPAIAAEYASQAAAAYIEASSLPIVSPAEARNAGRKPIKLAGGTIYLAGPFRELGQRMFIEDARQRLTDLGMTVFSPVHDIGPGPAEKVVAADLKAIDDCDAVFAILNGSSPGTVFEVGYARAKGKPVFCITQNMREVDLKLPIGSGCEYHRDYVSALHMIAWRE